MSQIFLDKVTKKYITYGNVTVALDNITLSINQGEMVSIMGPSGSGKTTMLNILGCLDNLSEGKYILKDKDISLMNSDVLAKIRNQNIGFIFQQFALIDNYNIEENLELPLMYQNKHNKKNKIPKKEIRNRIYQALKSLGIEDQINKLPSQLSGGQQQRVAIARAILSEPDILIADEPTGALDQTTGEDVMDLLININKKGKTVIIVTHDEKIAAYCNRKINILDGKIVSDTQNKAV